MNIIGITKQEQEDIFRIVAAVLHLGNITFGEDDKGNAVVLDASSNSLPFFFLFFKSHYFY